tara:strand:- start:159 stop:413 length:255 start_codon:yes stop_codon:yes gene_type:complete
MAVKRQNLLLIKSVICSLMSFTEHSALPPPLSNVIHRAPLKMVPFVSSNEWGKKLKLLRVDKSYAPERAPFLEVAAPWHQWAEI